MLLSRRPDPFRFGFVSGDAGRNSKAMLDEAPHEV